MKHAFIKLAMAFLVLACLATTVFALVDANGNRVTTRDSNTSLLSFDAKKAAEVKAIGGTILALNLSATSATALATVSPESAQLTIDFINDLVATMNGYKTQVSATTTQAELDAVNAAMKVDLNAKKTEYRIQMNGIVKVFADDAYQKALGYIQIANSTLSIYKVKCPGQSASINNIQKQLDTLAVEAGKLNTAIQTNDVAAEKAEMKIVSNLMVTITAQMVALDAAVTSGIDTTCNP